MELTDTIREFADKLVGIEGLAPTIGQASIRAIIVEAIAKWEQQKDNVCLTAAAPDLLSAAKDALESLKRLEDKDGAYRVTNISQLQTAIIKAEGK
jgi:hypothetical protein